MCTHLDEYMIFLSQTMLIILIIHLELLFLDNQTTSLRWQCTQKEQLTESGSVRYKVIREVEAEGPYMASFAKLPRERAGTC